MFFDAGYKIVLKEMRKNQFDEEQNQDWSFSFDWWRNSAYKRIWQTNNYSPHLVWNVQTFRRRIKKRISSRYLMSKTWVGVLAGPPECSWPCWAGCSPGWRTGRSGSGCTGTSWLGCKSWSPRRPTLPWPPCRSHRSSGRSNPSYTWRWSGANTGLLQKQAEQSLLLRPTPGDGGAAGVDD